MSSRPPVFLRARWEQLVFLNYEAPRALLEPLVPRGTELDDWGGVCLFSLVGFRFADTRVLGLSVPGHRTFEEVNLRFYVRRHGPDGSVRRGVVFVRELVPRAAIALVARVLYNEPYLSVPMHHEASLEPSRGGRAEYGWAFEARQFSMSAAAQGASTALEPDSEAEFITEHYFGYTRQRDGGTLEYEVEHPRWDVWRATSSEFEGPAAALYGAAFAEILARPPRTAYLALGSEVSVRRGGRIA
jgi:uncharacterized protein YqjF (DUF2071 family)